MSNENFRPGSSFGLFRHACPSQLEGWMYFQRTRDDVVVDTLSANLVLGELMQNAEYETAWIGRLQLYGDQGLSGFKS